MASSNRTASLYAEDPAQHDWELYAEHCLTHDPLTAADRESVTVLVSEAA